MLLTLYIFIYHIQNNNFPSKNVLSKNFISVLEVSFQRSRFLKKTKLSWAAAARLDTCLRQTLRAKGTNFFLLHEITNISHLNTRKEGGVCILCMCLETPFRYKGYTNYSRADKSSAIKNLPWRG